MEAKNLPRPIEGLKHDGELWVSVGRSCNDTKWKNKKTSWSGFLRRFQEPTRTQETYKEFLKMPVSDQGNVKDVGGFVGGTLTGGRRKADAVKDRYLLAFDLDSAPQGFVEDLDVYADNAMMVYSTHKHSPETPRFRVIVPLRRPVSPDEYEAVMRVYADSNKWMPYLDASTFQPSRLMYWPSCSRDAEYVFRYWDLPFLDPDKVLSLLPDWTDASYWPTHPDEYRVDKSRRGKKQQDPTEKKNCIGVFCRTYDVPAAIDAFLSDVYEPTVREDRYTYIDGSTSGGLVIYDDGKFCYSNHGTDPASGMDLNAFDLVRIHKFGAQDENAKPDTPVNRLPSFRSMEKFVSEDEGCKVTLRIDKNAEMETAFDNAGFEKEEHEKDPDEWLKKLDYTESGNLRKSVYNLTLIFWNDPWLSGIRFNTFTNNIEIQKDKPVRWRKDGGAWRNSDDDQLYAYLGLAYNDFSQQMISATLSDAAQHRRFHPIREYFESLEPWDGVERAETLFIDYLGAEDNVYVREATKLWLRAAVARVFVPGCKFDYVPVVSGPPGIGKSTMMNKLGVKWFSDSLTFGDMRDKTAAEKLQGVWIHEISELKGMRDSAVEDIKAFISRQDDMYRPAYGRRTESHPRGCVFIGTSNDQDYLRDVTGNRRFWPMPVTGKGLMNPFDLTEDIIRQIWAEAYAEYKAKGCSGMYLSKEADALAEIAQTNALETNDSEGIIALYLEKLIPEDWKDRTIAERVDYFTDEPFEKERPDGVNEREFITTIEIWRECLHETSDLNKRTSSELGVILRRLGYEKASKKRRAGPYGVQWYWTKK